MITFIAFIVNIGIFVKAKINLQNATDAAAYAGAAVQARQLTNIAYMNWEMRNVYKEWMFKYYVLGSLNLEGVAGASASFDPNTDFTMKPYTRTTQGGAQGVVDYYNFPSVCIDFANTGGVGMCTRYLVPGLPRFEASNVLGMDETTNAFIDTIVTEKAKDCSQRSELNFYTANAWAYNVNIDDADNTLSAAAPQVAANFMGAFPKAFELALRVRNLEAQVNFPPMGNVCANKGYGIKCNVEAGQLNKPSHERAMKAFLSGYKNIGRTPDKQMQTSFTLTELSPSLNTSLQKVNSLSTLLIPDGHAATRKYYLDLKLMTVNYSTFYTAFTASTGDVKAGGQAVSAEAQCNATKIGLPIPGYPLGFTKNPDILTYYAVEGKVKFTGLFNPFDQDNMILTAYAAAKPFGGRIGPMLFNVSERDGYPYVKPRAKKKSSAYISALDTQTFRGATGKGGGSDYEPGMPVPLNMGNDLMQFWLMDDQDQVGGKVAGNEIFYGVPNLIYDYPRDSISNREDYLNSGSDNIQVIAHTKITGENPTAGLYNKAMFTKFSNNLRNIRSANAITTSDINDAIFAVKAPTLYDANNYLIPTPETVNKGLRTDSWGVIAGIPKTFTTNSKTFNVYQLNLYAPLYSSNDPAMIYKSTADLETAISGYLEFQEDAILKYRNAMNIVAADIFSNNKSGTSDQNTGAAAAMALSDLTPDEFEKIENDPTVGASFLSTNQPSCASINGKFVYFYTGNVNFVKESTAKCGLPPWTLKDLMLERWNGPGFGGEIYSNEYTLSEDLSAQLFTAYRPGREHDAGSNDGVHKNAISGTSTRMIRNFYSTKLIPLKSIAGKSSAYGSNDNMLIYSEGHPKSISPDALRSTFKNPLDTSSLTIDLGSAEL